MSDSSLILAALSSGVDQWGGQFGQNGQKLHENYKISTFGSKQWGGGHEGGQANFSGSGGDPPSPPY